MNQNHSISLILEVIASLDKMFKQIYEKKGDKRKTILLLGNTGSGKSTIFNWLSGAKFKYEDEKLTLIEEQGKNYSKQGDSMESITFEPNFNMIDEEYMLIDFPGFKDTQGAKNQLAIQLMFNEVVTSTEVKLVVVTEQPQGKIPQRGARILELVQNTFTSKDTKFESIGYIINKFGDKKFKDDEIAKGFIKKQLEEIHQTQEENKDVYRALQQNIIIVRKPTLSNLIFNDEQRKSLFDLLKQIKPITYQPDKVDQDQIVSNYIANTLNQLFFQFRKSLSKQKDDAKKNNTTNQFNNTLQEILKQIGQIKYKDQQCVLEWMSKHILLNIQNEDSTAKFLQIFRFFFKYQANIEGFQAFQENILEVKQTVESIIQEIQAEIQRINDEEERYRRQKEEENRKHRQYMEQLRRDQAEEQRRRREEIQQRREEEQRKEEERKKQQQKMEQELKEKKARELEQQRKKEETERQMQEQRIKQQQEEQRIKQQQEQQRQRQQEKNSYICKLENYKKQLLQKKQQKAKYIESQSGVFMAVIGGDWKETYNKNIQNYDSDIGEFQNQVDYIERQLLNYY
ncbi:unnamed protein product [Paramecium octaurelia]|uniref:G domain-containing protein n=1 Tax=Paramecium octaurelia TaxID=43137 RepID=A0A8S1Y8N9_PAROT|nr:unnamed protein product [Paramecium octaurelia]